MPLPHVQHEPLDRPRDFVSHKWFFTAHSAHSGEAVKSNEDGFIYIV